MVHLKPCSFKSDQIRQPDILAPHRIIALYSVKFPRHESYKRRKRDYFRSYLDENRFYAVLADVAMYGKWFGEICIMQDCGNRNRLQLTKHLEPIIPLFELTTLTQHIDRRSCKSYEDAGESTVPTIDTQETAQLSHRAWRISLISELVQIGQFI